MLLSLGDVELNRRMDAEGCWSLNSSSKLVGERVCDNEEDSDAVAGSVSTAEEVP